MRRGLLHRIILGSIALLPAAICLSGCRTPGEWSQLIRGAEEDKLEKERLARELAERERKLKELHAQVETLQAWDGDRPVAVFAPAALEIVKLTGGKDYDGQPGDDGVTVYVRPRDAEGDVVKAPGKLTVQLLDNSDLAKPRVVALCEFADPDELRGLWHGKFLTNHYSLDCPFPADAALPGSGKLTATVTFVDYLTGKTLTASKDVTFSRPKAAETVGAKP